MRKFSPHEFRQHFPALNDQLVYLDSAATSLKPQTVVDSTLRFYSEAGTVHRSQHRQAQAMTERYEACRQQVANLITAPSSKQIIWTRGATESINLVAQAWLSQRLAPGDEILVSELEHHANLLPWLMLAEQTGAKVVCWPVTDKGELDSSSLPDYLSPKTKLLAISQMSNVTGYCPDLAAIVQQAQLAGVAVLVDGAQGIVHHTIDMQQLQPDFYVFSAHKLYGPTGVGVLYARADRLAEMRPVQGGGKMISQVDFTGYQLQPAPWCFEAGTPNIAGVIGFSSALDFHATIDLAAAETWACQLAEHAETALANLPGFISYRAPNSPLLSFTLQGIHSADVAALVAEQNIALRVGQHCAQPLLQALNLSGVIRASFAGYNSVQDVERMVSAVKFAYQLLTEE